MPERTSISRRGLLKGAAAAIAAPYIVSASALGKSGFKPASERITVGFIGIGNMGGGHLGGFIEDKEVQVVAVCDVDAVKRRDARNRVEKKYGENRPSGTYKGCDEYHEFEQLLARPDIDAVLIAVPDHWHATIAIYAARMGKDIYCEKPLTLTIREAQALVQAVRRYGRVFQTGSQQRSESNFRLACELVQSGRIGKVQKVNVGVGGPSQERYLPAEPVREGLDWERWLGPAPWQPYNATRCSGDYGGGWRHIRDYSGGMMTDWGAHHFDIAQWGLGMDGSNPVKIVPPAKAPDIRQTPNPDKGEGLVYHYANGVPVYHGAANGILFTGTDGKIEVNRGYLRTWPDEIGLDPLGANDVHLYESPGHRPDWINCIRTRQRPICDVAIGASTIITCHLGNIAYWLGRPIQPAAGLHVADDFALDRDPADRPAQPVRDVAQV
ncbi:MAG: Gfo/Idh/MocA family oxidoreductase, partial [Planctomycetes bacterium]|nr:Gfo/Idh/MocA family oxidoreductase [Planctomycetota bacterium]